MPKFKVLLCAMPDTALCFKRVGDIPNLGIASLAGNLPEGVEVKLVDLVVPYTNTGRLVRELLRDFRPNMVGLSAMSYQYDSAARVAAIVREERPGVPVVLGGYHATLLADEVACGPHGDRFDYFVRNEGELARAMNLEYLKLYFNPLYLGRSRFMRRRNIGTLRSLGRVTLNTLNHFPNLYKNELFLSRHSV